MERIRGEGATTKLLMPMMMMLMIVMASQKIYAAKGRPSDNPLIVHIYRFEDIYKITKEVPEGVVGRSALCRIYFLGGRRIQCISPQPVHGLGRKSHQSSLLQDCSRRPEFLLIFFADGALSGTNLYDLSLHVFTFCVLNCIWI